MLTTLDEEWFCDRCGSSFKFKQVIGADREGLPSPPPPRFCAICGLRADSKGPPDKFLLRRDTLRRIPMREPWMRDEIRPEELNRGFSTIAELLALSNMARAMVATHASGGMTEEQLREGLNWALDTIRLQVDLEKHDGIRVIVDAIKGKLKG